MKKRLDFVVIYFWLFLLLCAGLGTLIFADREERVSESERRMLAAFPDTSAESIFSGKFSSGFESFLSDGIFLRDSVAGASKAALGLFSAASYEDTMLLSSISMADEISGGTAAQDTAARRRDPPRRRAEAKASRRLRAVTRPGTTACICCARTGARSCLPTSASCAWAWSRTCSMSTKAFSRRTGRCSIPAYL